MKKYEVVSLYIPTRSNIYELIEPALCGCEMSTHYLTNSLKIVVSLFTCFERPFLGNHSFSFQDVEKHPALMVSCCRIQPYDLKAELMQLLLLNHLKPPSVACTNKMFELMISQNYVLVVTILTLDQIIM